MKCIALSAFVIIKPTVFPGQAGESLQDFCIQLLAVKLSQKPPVLFYFNAFCRLLTLASFFKTKAVYLYFLFFSNTVEEKTPTKCYRLDSPPNPKGSGFTLNLTM